MTYRRTTEHGRNISAGRRLAELERKKEKLAKFTMDEEFWKRIASLPRSQREFITDYLTQPVTWACLQDKYNVEAANLKIQYKRIMERLHDAR